MRRFKLSALAIVISALSATAFNAVAADAPVPAPSASAAMVSGPDQIAGAVSAKMSARITAINPTTREVTLKGAGGEEKTIVLGDEVKNFAQLKVGDLVFVRYAESLVMTLKSGKNSGIRERVETSASAAAASGAMPGGTQVQQVTMLANVVAKDTKKQTVTLRGAKKTVTVHVDDAERFKSIKVGDQVEAVSTKILAVNVSPAARAAKPASGAASK